MDDLFLMFLWVSGSKVVKDILTGVKNIRWLRIKICKITYLFPITGHEPEDHKITHWSNKTPKSKPQETLYRVWNTNVSRRVHP